MSIINNTSADTTVVSSVESHKLRYGEAAFFVTLDFSSFSGKKTAKTAKILADNGEDADAVTEKPRKRLVEKSALKFVAKHYMQAKRLFNKYGLPIWGGWLISKEILASAKVELAAIQNSYSAEADTFVKEYEALLEKQCEEHPTLAQFIRFGAPEPSEVRSRFFMELSPPLAMSLRNDEDQENASNAINIALFGQFADAAAALLESLTKQDGATQHALRPLRSLRDKANQFAFADGVWDGVVGFLDAVLARMPKTGKLEPADKATLMLALGMMEDETRLRTAAVQIQEMDLETLLMPETPADASEEFAELMQLREQQEQQEGENSEPGDCSDTTAVVDEHAEPEVTPPSVSDDDLSSLSAFFNF